MSVSLSCQLTSDLSGLSDNDVHDETLLVALLVHDGDLNGFPGEIVKITPESSNTGWLI